MHTTENTGAIVVGVHGNERDALGSRRRNVDTNPAAHRLGLRADGRQSSERRWDWSSFDTNTAAWVRRSMPSLANSRET